MKDRAETRKQTRLHRRNPNLIAVDASKFATQLSELTQTMINCVEREGPKRLRYSALCADFGVMLRQVRYTYNLLLFINSDEKRENDPYYRTQYSFVVLPLVRTMIDGFYNCTTMLVEPERARKFRISGLYRMREAIREDEQRHGNDSNWNAFLKSRREMYSQSMKAEGFAESDLDDRSNKWPLLGEYVRDPPTPHKEMLRELTHGYWKEYSSISHASYDGLLGLFPFIATDILPHDQREQWMDASERQIATHLARASALLLCLLTEMQNSFRFDGPARIDTRLAELWETMFVIPEVETLYNSRYKALLAAPLR